jgi:hypothetical protein
MPSSQEFTETVIYHDFFQKAEPREEGQRRFLRCIASNQKVDLDNERVMQKALRDSVKYFLDKGNVDLDHITKIGHKFGIRNPHEYEIGIPRDVKFTGEETICDVEIFQGESETCEKANFFWKSLTAQVPPQRWFPSVAGQVLKRSSGLTGGNVIKSVEAVRWNNLGFAKEPVNPNLPAVQVERLSKSISIIKTLVSGTETDVAQLTGGQAVRKESLGGVADETVGQKKKKKKRIKTLLASMKKGELIVKGGLDNVSASLLFDFYTGVLKLPREMACEFAKSDYLTINAWRKSCAI